MIQNRYKLKPAQTLICAGFVVPVSCICPPFAGSQGIQFRISAAILEGRLTDLRPPKISLGCAICIRRGACYADSWVGRRSDRDRRIYATLLWLGAVGASDIVMLPSLGLSVNLVQKTGRLLFLNTGNHVSASVFLFSHNAVYFSFSFLCLFKRD